MFYSVKTDEGSDAVLHFSLRSLNIYLHDAQASSHWIYATRVSCK